MEVKVQFIYGDKIIPILCSTEEKMSKIFEKFKNQVNALSEINNFIFYYEENILDPSTTFEQNHFFSGKKEITISVQKNLRIIKCPECIYNDCIINLSNYRASF